MNFRKVNNLFGWLIFGIATLVYLITMEPTVSFWDCGEFLSCAFKLEVGHSPGAPLFMMLQRLFGMFGPNPAAATKLINAWSAIMSSGTILFLFWTITHFARRLLTTNDEEPSRYQTALIIGAGLVGGLAYTFSDTFWFSAVEAEVYATSSFFTAITFWAILKWEHIADRPYADRWLVLIMYLMGLSIGIHLLNLLTIPTIAMVYYFRRYQPTLSGGIIAFIIGCVLLGFVQFGVIQGIPILASKFDLLFVNSMKLPLNSGAIFFMILLFIGILLLIRYFRRTGRYLAHLGTICLLFVALGFMSYVVPVIRSTADTPIDMTDPSNMMSLLSYVQREQFGEQPLLKGPYYTDRLTAIESKGPSYQPIKKDGKWYYEIVGRKPKYVYEDEHFFSRIWNSNDPNHVRYYENYLDLAPGEYPTAGDNWTFFFGHQMNWMWWRYFMWNYAGRQNDFQGHGDPKSGNWISGIKPVDKFFGRGDMDKMSDGYRNNGARNEYYFLPLILGIMGLVFHFNRRRLDGVVVLTLFFFTGIAIGIYLNMTPLQPRERDYAFAGSTYAFAIWIGLGVLMLNEWIRKAIKGEASAYASSAIALLLVPGIMVKENWDDHDRSQKTLAWATAYNTLSSLAPNAILFTYGDNDTYPVWYIQEVEGFRKDVRVINMSLLGIYWYIDQLNYKINDADAVPMAWKPEDYIGDKRQMVQLVTKAQYPQAPDIPANTFVPLEEIMKFITSDQSKLPTTDEDGFGQHYFPTQNFFVPGMSRDELVKSGMLSPEVAHRATEDGMRFNVGKRMLQKSDLAALAIVAENAKNGWKRPIYFGGGLGDNYEGMNDYMQLEGTVYRLVPYKLTPDSTMPPMAPQEMGFIDMKKSLDLFMNVYKWGGGERKDVYFDEKNRMMFVAYRLNAARIADELSAAGRKQEAIALLDKVMAGITEQSYYYDYTGLLMTMAYYHAGATDKARALAKKIQKNCIDDINWILSLNQSGRDAMARDARQDISFLNALAQSAQLAGDEAMAKELEAQINSQSQRLINGLSPEAIRAGM